MNTSHPVVIIWNILYAAYFDPGPKIYSSSRSPFSDEMARRQVRRVSSPMVPNRDQSLAIVNQIFLQVATESIDISVALAK